MKSIIKVILTCALSAVILGVTSCLNDDPIIDWSVIKPVIELADNDHTQYANNMQRGDVAEFKIIVNYTASYASDVKENIEVQLEVDLDTIAKINANLAASEQPFEPFPVASYENLILKTTIPAGSKRDTIYLEVDINDDFKVGRSYILPLKIAGASDGYIISGNFNYLDLEINMAEPEVDLSVLPAKEGDVTPSIRNDVNVGEEVIFNVQLGIDYPVTISDEDVEVGLSIDPSRVAILNASMTESDIPFQLLSSEEIPLYFEVTPDIAVLPYDPDGGDVSGTEQQTVLKIEKGKMKTDIKVKANTSIMQPGLRYILPLQIDNVSDHYTTGSNNLIYLEVNMAG